MKGPFQKSSIFKNKELLISIPIQNMYSLCWTDTEECFEILKDATESKYIETFPNECLSSIFLPTFLLRENYFTVPLSMLSVAGFIPKRKDSVARVCTTRSARHCVYIVYIYFSFLERSRLRYNFLLRHNQEKSPDEVIQSGGINSHPKVLQYIYNIITSLWWKMLYIS